MSTVEQEIFTTGKFREFAASGGSRQECGDRGPSQL